MAQSDYLARKRSKAQLAYPSDLSSVIGAQEYTTFKKFELETNPAIVFDKPSTFQKLVFPGAYRVNNMDIKVNPQCPTSLCGRTRPPMHAPMFVPDLHYIYRQTNVNTNLTPCRKFAIYKHTPTLKISTTLVDDRFKRIDSCIS